MFVVNDQSARPSTGAADGETFRRIEEGVVKDEVARAGFKLVVEADFLRNPADTRDWNDSPRAAGEPRHARSLRAPLRQAVAVRDR